MYYRNVGKCLSANQPFGIHLALIFGFWKTDHIVMREINRIAMFMHL